jgi:hypothetical protein
LELDLREHLPLLEIHDFEGSLGNVIGHFAHLPFQAAYQRPSRLYQPEGNNLRVELGHARLVFAVLCARSLQALREVVGLEVQLQEF